MKMASAIAAMLFAWMTVAFAQAVDIFPDQRHLCDQPSQVVRVPNISAPPLVDATLRRVPTLAFRLCNDRWGAHYFLRAPEPVSNGVCSFFEKEVFSPTDLDVTGAAPTDTTPKPEIRWSNPPPPWSTDAPTAIKGEQPVQFMAAQRSAACPPLDSPGYITVHGVSAEGFQAMEAFWRSLTSSEKNFAAAVSRIAECQHDIERDALFHNPDAAKKSRERKIEAFHAFVFDQPEGLRAFSMTFAGDVYSVLVWGTDNRFVPFRANVQVTGNGLELANLCNVYVA
jgi:hypothetical protein